MKCCTNKSVAKTNKMKFKQADEIQQALEQERLKAIISTVKQMLIAIRNSENFGEQRLIRILKEWVEINSIASKDKDEMLIIDDIISKVLGTEILENIGREEFICKP